MFIWVTFSRTNNIVKWRWLYRLKKVEQSNHYLFIDTSQINKKLARMKWRWMIAKRVRDETAKLGQYRRNQSWDWRSSKHYVIAVGKGSLTDDTVWKDGGESLGLREGLRETIAIIVRKQWSDIIHCAVYRWALHSFWAAHRVLLGQNVGDE